MTNKNLDYYKRKLLDEKKETLHTIKSEKENGAHELFQDYYNELSVYDNHPADVGSELYEMEMRMNLENKEHMYLQKIDKALDKIKNGTYGVCEACGKEIKDERLEVVPYTEVCIECSNNDTPLSSKIETRPIEEDVLKTPYNRTFKDNSNYNGFDGEDAWQAVARYNDIPNDPSDNGSDHIGYLDENERGIVDEVEQISQDYYLGQIEGLNRKDIPDNQRKDKE